MTLTLPRGDTREDPREALFTGEIVEGAKKDRDLLETSISNLEKLFTNEFHTSRVTLCDAGTVEDIMELLKQFRPHPADRVEAHARLVARDEWGA